MNKGEPGRQNLHLEDGQGQRLSEVQTYMSMFYTSQIQPTVLSRWAEVKAAYPGSNDAQDLAEGEPLSENGVFRDVTIPISYKNAIAQELWDVEDEGIKKQVWVR